MASKEPKSLFQRLTQVFRSQPAIRRKVRGFDTTMALADKTKSSGTLLFQKSLSPTYASITSNAYNLSERLMRYQDFQEMEYTPEIAAACDIYCLASDTVIPLLDGTKLTVKELYDSKRSQFGVYSFDIESKKFVPGNCERVLKTGVNQQIFRVTFDDGLFVRLTQNHLVLLSDGQYKRVKDLVENDSIRSMYTKFSSKEQGDNINGYEQILDPCENKWKYTHRIVAEHVYGLTKGVVHHVNFNKLNNEAKNLQFMSQKEHLIVHKNSNSEKWKNDKAYAKKMSKIFSEHAKSLHAQPDWTDQFLQRRDEVFVSYDAATRKELFGRKGDQNGMFDQGHKIIGEKNGRWNENFVREVSREQIVEWILSGKRLNDVIAELPMRQKDMYVYMKRAGILKWDRQHVIDVNDIVNGLKNWIARQPSNRLLTRGFSEACEFVGVSRNVAYLALNNLGYKHWNDYLSRTNHRVVSVALDGYDDVYDLQVEKWHNFAISGVDDSTSYVVVHNSDEVVSQDEKGNVLHIYSNNEKIREELTDLFLGTLNIDFALRGWTRNLCKYGDFFLYNDVHPDHGVVNAFPIPVNEIEREENFDRDDPFAVRFRWVTLGNRTLENWEISHFRLLGNDMFLPYGSSILEPARRIWRQLILIEDAMLVYRVVRAPERRVFYIDVANLPPENVPMYVEEQRKNLRTSQVIDRDTGRVDLRYNPMCISMRSTIKLQDGRVLSLKDLIKERESGKQDQWAYSIDLENKRLVPGKIVWAGTTRKDAQLVRVHLDDGHHLDVTPDHKFMLRDGSYLEAEKLTSGQSLMPLYTKLSDKASGDYIQGYEQTYDPFSGEYEYTHRINAKVECLNKDESIEGRVIIHHVDFNKRNNDPSNLRRMEFFAHKAYHAEHCEKTLNTPEMRAKHSEDITRYNKSDAKRKKTSEDNRKYKKAQKMCEVYNGSELHTSHNEIRSAAMKEFWADPVKSAQSAAKRKFIWNDKCQSYVVGLVKQLEFFEGLEAFLRRLKNDEQFMSVYRETNSHLNRDLSKSFHKFLIGKFIMQQHDDWKSIWSENNPQALQRKKNHKVVCVEWLEQREDTGCVTIEKYHNFAAGGEDTQKMNSFIYLHNSVDEDYIIPVRGSDTGTRIDTLAGGQNVAAVEDVSYIQKKLIAALKIPRAYLGYDDALSSKASLSQLDIRFSRTISVIQKTIITELNKLAIIHLYSLGYDGDDLQDFTLRLSNPSTVAQQQKLELWRAKFEIAGTAPEGMVDRSFVRREVLGLNDEQIAALDVGRIKDKLADAAVESAEPTGEPSGTGEDLFGGGGDEGEEAPDKEEPEAGEEGGTPPGPETAGEEPEEQEEPGLELLTSADDRDDDEDFALKVKLDKATSPVKVQQQLQRALYNRGRRRTHGSSKTDMPNHFDMTSGTSREMMDPYDTDWLKSVVSNPFGESKKPSPRPPKLPPDIMAMLAKVPRRRSTGVIVEGTDVQNQIDNVLGMEAVASELTEEAEIDKAFDAVGIAQLFNQDTTFEGDDE